MAYEFPTNPTVGDTYSKFAWNGAAWVLAVPEATDLESRVAELEEKATDIRNFVGPTGADGEPEDYNVLVIDKANGQVRAIPATDSIEPE